jgi:AraC-like DNA-binding protein
MSDIRHHVRQPQGDLRRYVRDIFAVCSDRPRVQALLPETTFTMVLRQAGSASLHNAILPNAIVSGLQQRARMVEHGAGSSLVIVRFTEVGASALLRERADLLYDQTMRLEDVLPQQHIDRIQNILADTRDMKQQVLAVENFLIGRVHTQNEISPQIEAAVRMIRNTNGRYPVAAIARRVAMSQSALERHFRNTVGTTPKRLSRLARLNHVYRLWKSGKSLTEIAFEAGYTDQPHLVRDFRLFTGASPLEFFRKDPSCNLPTFYK